MSIQLGTSYVVGGAGVAQESCAHAALTSIDIDFEASTIKAVLSLGTSTVAAGKAKAFASDPNAPRIMVLFDLAANTWRAFGQAGARNAPSPLTAGEISALNAILSASAAACRNPGEGFAVSHGLFGTGCTTVPW